MASMQNQEESNFLNDLLPFNSKYYWIGVRKDGEAWLRDGTDQKVPEDAQDWALEEPDGIEGQDCVEVYIKRDKDTAKWNNENCRKKKGTVCYSGKALLLNSLPLLPKLILIFYGMCMQPLAEQIPVVNMPSVWRP